MGVRRAVELAGAEAKAGGPVYTMGPLIHNPQALEMLRALGVRPLEEDALPADLGNRTVIIRAHGISPALESELAARGARIADATCPRVKASQRAARALSGEGCRVFLAGDRRHGELVGIRGYAPEGIIVANPEEAAEAARGLYREIGNAGKTALIGQTTISPGEYQAIGDAIARFFPDLRVMDTICGATRERQDALRELRDSAEALIVAGGRESANTRRLLAIAREGGKPAWLVETPGDIPAGIAAFSVVGLCAGASTPDEAVDAIERALLGAG
jgi:4-hydroxy-3-methylbut-2-enyl diphosphate reductase